MDGASARMDGAEKPVTLSAVEKSMEVVAITENAVTTNVNVMMAGKEMIVTPRLHTE